METAANPLIVLAPDDDVAVARLELAAGSPLAHADLSLTCRDAIPAGHKLALRAIPAGGLVRKYGQVIGMALSDIQPGELVHVHNLGMPPASARGGQAPASAQAAAPVQASFQGYRRSNGAVGTRNYLGIVSSVNCSATVCRKIAQAFTPERLAAWPNVDGVVAITHGGGCGTGVSGEGVELLRRTLQGYADQPNFAGVLVIGLGCEAMQSGALVASLRPRDEDLLAHLVIQEAGGTAETIARGIALIEGMLPLANRAERTPQPASALRLGLQCGGSDGYSGISANPALGAAVDLLVRAGGTAILSETPEIYGAEHLLTTRAVVPGVADALLERIRWWEAYVTQHGGEMDNNPSPGNKRGGLTTILEKSLGAVAKGGSSPLVAVYRYAEPVTAAGLVFMDTPGYDPVSATGQVAGGANLLCFTTGRGSTYGCKPTPSVKIASNDGLFQRMAEDMDFNAGPIVTGQESIAAAGQRLFELLLAVASGQRTCSESNDLGDNEFVPWQLGAVM